MDSRLSAFLQELLHATPGIPPSDQPGGIPGDPADMGGPPQPPPFDTSQVPGTSFGGPATGGADPMAQLMALAGGQQSVDTSAPLPGYGVGGTTNAPMPNGANPVTPQIAPGYQPQPRPDLPPQIAGEPFGQFTSRYTPATPPQDPLAALMASAGPQDQPPSQGLMPPWMQGGAGPQMGGGGTASLTESERSLLRKSDAYARAIARIHSLRQHVRGPMGY